MSDGAGLEINRRSEGNAIVLEPDGDVDMNASVPFRAALSDALRDEPDRLVVDLDRVGHMDSAGLATLVEAMRHAKDRGVELILCSLNDRVRGVFEIARLDQYFRIVGSVELALEG